VQFTCAARTDVGIVRSGNEDNYLMLAERGIFIVADGMGGHAAGEVASEMAVRLISRDLGTVRGLPDEEVAERMRQSIRAANAAIYERTLTEHDKRGMGTTATALVVSTTTVEASRAHQRCGRIRDRSSRRDLAWSLTPT
jgi:protein phosphatase